MDRKLTLLILLATFAGSITAQPYIPPDYYGEDEKESIGFWPNQGQVVDTYGDPRPDIAYYSDGGYPRLYMRKGTQMSFVMNKVDTLISTPDTAWRVDMRLVGEEVQVVDPIVYEARSAIRNFYLPWCGSGVTGVTGYSRTIYEGVYPEIDMHFYSGRRGQKMAFVINPGGDPDNLILQFEGQDSLGIDIQGALRIYLNQKWIRLEEAVAYQVGTGNTIIPVGWSADYQHVQGSAQVTFNFSTYDPNKPLIFQIGPPPVPSCNLMTPGVCWGTYFGGDNDDQIRASIIDDLGNFYVAGRSYAQSLYFPIFNGTVIAQGSPTVFVSRFDPQDQLIWSNFYGGSSGDQYAAGVTVTSGSSPRLYIAGRTEATDLFVQDPGGGAYYNPGGSVFGGFIAEFEYSAGGAVWSTYFGTGGVYIRNCTVDKNDRLVVVGETSGSLPTHQVPLPPNAEQWAYVDSSDAFIALFTPANQVLWSTFMGGTGYDNARSVRCAQSKIVVSGFTYSPSMQTFDPGAGAFHEATNAGDMDVFIFEFDLNGDQTWGTLFGGSSTDELGEQGLAIDPVDGDVVIVGRTFSNNIPLQNTGQFYDGVAGFPNDGFITQFSGDDRSLVWSTYVGENSDFARMTCVEVQDDGQIFAGGTCSDTQFPARYITGLYTEANRLGYGDGVLMCFTTDHALVWSTYFGGDEPLTPNHYADIIWSLALKDGVKLYVTGTTYSACDLGQFFPLSDPLTGAFFDDILDQPNDAFIAGFCIDGILTSVAENSASEFGAYLLGADQLLLSGLNDGPTVVTIQDALGKLIHRDRVVVIGGRATMRLPVMSSGTYSVLVPDFGSQRFAVVR